MSACGLASTSDNGPAAARLRQTRDFYTYLLAELPPLIERWHESREAGLNDPRRR